MNARILAVVALLGLTGVPAFAMDLPGPVVTPEWLNQHRGQVTVLDVREDLDSFSGTPVFSTDAKTGKKSLSRIAGHIPGALLVDYSRVRVEREIDGRRIKALLPDKEYFQALMRGAGVPKGKPIVITVPGGAAEDLDTAARMYWSIRYYGDDAMAILDGGTAAWLEAGLPVSSARPSTKLGDWEAGAGNPGILADSEEVARAIGSKTQLVDARPLPYFLGLAVRKPTVTAAGHIAGAVDFPGEVRAQKSGASQHFLAEGEYRSVFQRLGIQQQGPSIVYCNTGHMASGAWFVMSEVLGNKEAKLYDGSMHQWTVEGRPVVGLE